MSSDLTTKHCRSCQANEAPLDKEKVQNFLKNLPAWQIEESEKEIVRTLIMKDFSAAIEAIQKIATLAQEEQHHPDIHLTGYRKLKIVLSTHAIKGLSENDFILAAKINALPLDLKV